MTAPSAFAPLRRRAFRWLWVCVLVSGMGVWMQTVGAQWLLVDSPPSVVALVQSATALPITLLALPAGVLADSFDRRHLLIGVQCYAIAVAALLATLSFLGDLPPSTVLAFTFATGAANALLMPTWGR